MAGTWFVLVLWATLLIDRHSTLAASDADYAIEDDRNETMLCFQCQSQFGLESPQCENDVGSTRKYKVPPPSPTDKCYAIIDGTQVIRGSFGDHQYKMGCTSGTCRVCQGRLCNHWNAHVDLNLFCTSCTNCSEVGTFGSGELRYKEQVEACNVTSGPLENYYCATDDQDRGCIAGNANGTVACLSDNCNSPTVLKNSTCWSFHGFKAKFERLRKEVRCRRGRKSHLSGCYTEYLRTRRQNATVDRGEVRMGCLAEFPYAEAAALFARPSTFQLCVEGSNCNGVWRNECFDFQRKASVLCVEQSERCFVKRDPVTLAVSGGCVNKAEPSEPVHPDTRYCTNNLTDPDAGPCNAVPDLLLANMACFVCSGPLCRTYLGSRLMETCADNVTQCYQAEGYERGDIERGCWSNETKSALCQDHPQFCRRCSRAYCNDVPAELRLKSCLVTGFVQPCASVSTEDGALYLRGLSYPEAPEEIMMISSKSDNTNWQRSRRLMEQAYHRRHRHSEKFACYQCSSRDRFDASCAGDATLHRQPKPCDYAYGSKPASCYTLVHRKWETLERGCGSSLDPWTYASCNSGRFAECRICTEAGCNGRDYSKMLLPRTDHVGTFTKQNFHVHMQELMDL